MTEVPADPRLVTTVTEDHRPRGQYAITLPCMKTALQLSVVMFVSTALFGQEAGNRQLPNSSPSLSLVARADVGEMAAPNAPGMVAAASPTVEPVGAMLMPVETSKAENSTAKKKVWYGLMAAEHSAAFLDAYTTQQAVSSGGGRELDPLVRPFANSAAVYPALQVSPLAVDYISARMMRSNNRLMRKFWWLPQAAGIVGSTLCGVQNLSHIR